MKGQTPKVDKTVKPKAPRGRALKRIQYNKRFFSAVAQTGGRKKGPNAQVRSFVSECASLCLFCFDCVCAFFAGSPHWCLNECAKYKEQFLRKDKNPRGRKNQSH